MSTSPLDWILSNYYIIAIVLVNIILIGAIVISIKKITNGEKLQQESTKTTNENILDQFIKEQEALALAGSGDDEVYKNQISKYVNKQRGLWLALIDKLR